MSTTQTTEVTITCTNCTGIPAPDTRTDDDVMACPICRTRYSNGVEVEECGYHFPDLACRLPECPHCGGVHR